MEKKELQVNEYIIHLCNFDNDDELTGYCNKVGGILKDHDFIKETTKTYDSSMEKMLTADILIEYPFDYTGNIYAMMKNVYELCNDTDSHMTGLRFGWVETGCDYADFKTLSNIEEHYKNSDIARRQMLCQILFKFYEKIADAKPESKNVINNLPDNFFEFMRIALYDMLYREINPDMKNGYDEIVKDKVAEFIESVVLCAGDNLISDIYGVGKQWWKQSFILPDKYSIEELLDLRNCISTNQNCVKIKFEHDFSMESLVYGYTVMKNTGKSERLYVTDKEVPVYMWTFIDDDIVNLVFVPLINRDVPGDLHISCVRLTVGYSMIDFMFSKLYSMTSNDRVNSLMERCVHESIIRRTDMNRMMLFNE